MREDLLPGRLGSLGSFCRYMGLDSAARGNLVVGEDGGRDDKVVGCLGRCMVLKLLFLD